MAITEMLDECSKIVAEDANTEPIINNYRQKLLLQLNELQWASTSNHINGSLKLQYIYENHDILSKWFALTLELFE